MDPEELRRLKRVDAAAISLKQKLSEMDVLAVVQNDSTYLQVGAGSDRWGEGGECARVGDRAIRQTGSSHLHARLHVEPRPRFAVCCSCPRFAVCLLLLLLHQSTEGVKYYRKPFEFLSLGM